MKLTASAMPTPRPLPKRHHLFPTLLSTVLCTGLALSAARAGDASAKLAKSILEPEPPESRVHLLINLEVSDHYITPRGLNVENQG